MICEKEEAVDLEGRKNHGLYENFSPIHQSGKSPFLVLRQSAFSGDAEYAAQTSAADVLVYR